MLIGFGSDDEMRQNTDRFGYQHHIRGAGRAHHRVGDQPVLVQSTGLCEVDDRVDDEPGIDFDCIGKCSNMLRR